MRSERLLFTAAVLLIAVLSPLAASGSAAGSADTSHSGIANSEMVFPRINPVTLGSRKLAVVATTSFIGDILTDIAGTNADITILMPRGQNPHSWEPSPGNIVTIEDADLIFINGLGLEEELLNILESMETAPVVPVSLGIEGLEITGMDEHNHDTVNPHVWFSPLNVINWAENIETALSLSDPVNREKYKENADDVIQELQALDSEIRSMVSVLDSSEKKLVTDHASFDYFARDYGFEIPGNLIPSMNDQAEPSARDIAALTELVKNESVKAIFVGGTAGRGLKSLASSVAAEADRELPVVELLSGSLAPEGQRGDSYPDFIRYNTELIVENLGRK